MRHKLSFVHRMRNNYSGEAIRGDEMIDISLRYTAEVLLRPSIVLLKVDHSIYIPSCEVMGVAGFKIGVSGPT